ncbi:MAG TPA: cytochrome P450 [Trueperaceae bacterium]
MEYEDGVWHVGSYAAARQVLRAGDVSKQAGFNSEAIANVPLRKPVLFQDGASHKEQRVATARFFTPKTVDERYRSLMERLSEELVRGFQERGHIDLARTSLAMAVQVASQVVGLTDSLRPGMERRLERLVSLERFERVGRFRRLLGTVRSHAGMLDFFVSDVRPAIRRRRIAPREDVISHLLEKGYGPVEILIECITYGAAGMATTREFICMAAWHLLEDDELRADYLAAGEAERHRILHEILRLEPVVGRLYRRTVAPLLIADGDEEVIIPAGALLSLDIGAANADEGAVGPEPLTICPGRNLAPGVQAPALSFGDGAHRCPGAFVAIQESDIFLRRFLALPVEVDKAPTIRWNELIEGYELRDFRVRLRSRGQNGSSA